MNKEDLVSFTIKTLEEIDTNADYLHNWHIELICEYLKKVYIGDIKRLIINVPPRSLKSVCVSVAFPSWVLANNPSEKIIAVSYSQVLGIKHSTDCRKIMQSNWYQKITNTRIRKGESEKRKFITLENGYRFTTSVGGSLTGEGGNIIIVDDPHNPLKIFNPKEREKVHNWFEGVLMSRLNNKKKGKIIIVMQRLHIDDLTGYLTSKKYSPWKILSIPAIEDQDKIYHFNNKIYKFRQEGDILHNKREDIKLIQNTISELGSFVFSAQYQQNPISADGIINKNWFCEVNDENIKFESIYFSLDTAVSQNENSDYTVIMKIGVLQNSFYILDIIRERLNYIQLKNKMLNTLSNDINTKIIIEDKNIGSSLIQDLKSLTKNPIISVNPHKDKLTRLISVISILESKKVLILKDAKWKKDFLLEATSFPNGLHDDQVDTLTQFLNYIKDKKEIKRNPRLRML